MRGSERSLSILQDSCKLVERMNLRGIHLDPPLIPRILTSYATSLAGRDATNFAKK
jgi:hypothetical protein